MRWNTGETDVADQERARRVAFEGCIRSSKHRVMPGKGMNAECHRLNLLLQGSLMLAAACLPPVMFHQSSLSRCSASTAANCSLGHSLDCRATKRKRVQSSPFSAPSWQLTPDQPESPEALVTFTASKLLPATPRSSESSALSFPSFVSRIDIQKPQNRLRDRLLAGQGM